MLNKILSSVRRNKASKIYKEFSIQQIMLDKEQYYEKRHELTSLVNHTHPKQVETELAIFDLMYSTKKDRMKKEDKAIADFFAKYQSLGLNNNQKNNFITEFKHLKKTYKHDTAYSIVIINDDLQDYDYESHYGKFEISRPCMSHFIGDPLIRPDLEKLAKEDGAIILDNKGNIIATNTYLVNVNPKTIPDSRLNLYIQDKERYDPRFYGFKQDVSTRHLSALGASYAIPGIIVYTLGENMDKTLDDNTPIIEYGQIRRYENGLITLSTLISEEKITFKNQAQIIEELKHEK
jgi:hypothetical protein